MDNNAGSNEQHNNISDESTNSIEQKYVIMDNGNAKDSNADMNISEASAVDEDIESNNRGGDETSNNTWSKDNAVIKPVKTQV